jgi:hypothetical protein
MTRTKVSLRGRSTVLSQFVAGRALRNRLSDQEAAVRDSGAQRSRKLPWQALLLAIPACSVSVLATAALGIPEELRDVRPFDTIEDIVWLARHSIEEAWSNLTERIPGYNRWRGRRSAEHDIATGRLEYWSFGMSFPWTPAAAARLERDFGVVLRQGGCVLDGGGFRAGYDERVREEIQKRFGRDVVVEVFEEEEDAWRWGCVMSNHVPRREVKVTEQP